MKENEDFFSIVVNRFYKEFNHKKIIFREHKYINRKELFINLLASEYYLINDIIIWKGKKMFFKGKILECTKQKLIDFINENVTDIWARNYYIISKERDNEAFFINEEGSILRIAKSQETQTNGSSKSN